MGSHDSAALPPETADRFTKPLGRFLKIEAAAGIALLVATCSALLLSSSPWSTAFSSFWEISLGFRFGSFDFSRSLQHWINDGLMTLFFFVVALELKRELVLGELRDRRRTALSCAGALGGMLVPVGVYLAITVNEPGMHGWGVVMATDTAFVIGSLAVLGSRVPPSLRLFLLSLAIFDDVGAILVVAIGYGDAIVWSALAVAALGVAVVFGIARIGFRSIPVYILLGAIAWLGFDASGIHPTVIGVVLGLMTPARAWVSDVRLHAIFTRVLAYPRGEHWSGDTADRADLLQAGRAARETLSAVEQIEMKLHPWVGFVIMPLFALANAGVSISSAGLTERVTVAIVAGLVLGKPIGVFASSWLAVRLGLATRPSDLSWPVLGGGAFLTGIGFTMSLFIAGLAYSPAMLQPAKIGILAGSVVSATIALVVLGWLGRKKRTTRPTRSSTVVEGCRR
ncbi:Na+/H+ antiporter NhaA [Paraliomyxa miuraensis]|uniref:Na+/H+ antiporter NhaA n=1 Tax=Paraliomyxa miuraensis TaxID=376150 RepID=UPI002253EE31|nr:Na+/H+ antiporter NhaA [Paraliomyxa miuraensis]MCX4239227.1 Na+/H+ antiporter NhaA [Paraliomyxa miuraensis]